MAVANKPTRVNFKISKLFIIASAKVMNVFELGNSASCSFKFVLIAS